MTLKTNKTLSEFKYMFDLPNKEFTKFEPKELKVILQYKDGETAEYMRCQKIGSHAFNNCYFIVNLPKYILDYVKGKNRLYSKDGIHREGTYAEGTPIYREKYNFINTIKSDTFIGLRDKILSITNDALHFKQLENLEKYNKIIFINSNFELKESVDAYNYGKTGNKLNLMFQYFVAYKVIKKKNLIVSYWQTKTDNDNEVIEYYARDSGRKNKLSSGEFKKLPLLTGYEIKHYKQIPWSKERELFFYQIEQKLKIISNKINSFINNINADNIDIQMIKYDTNKLLEHIESDNNEDKNEYVCS